jgi:hypothetical protein
LDHVELVRIDRDCFRGLLMRRAEILSPPRRLQAAPARAGYADFGTRRPTRAPGPLCGEFVEQGLYNASGCWFSIFSLHPLRRMHKGV